MGVLPVRVVEQIILHIEGNGAHVLRDIFSGKSPAGQDEYKAEKDYEE